MYNFFFIFVNVCTDYWPYFFFHAPINFSCIKLMEKCCSFHLSDIVCLCMYYFQIDIYIGVFEIFRLLLLSSHMPPPTVHPSFLLTRFICLKFKFLFFFSDFYSYKCLDLNNFVIFRVGAVFMFTKYVRRETGKKNIIPL